METVVRPVERKDAAAWLSLRRALWPEEAAGEHESEIEEFFAGRSLEPLAVLIAQDQAGRRLGFAELSIRSHADGCRTNRIGYLEGWFVAPSARRRGIGRALVRAGEDWARSRGCTEFASDTRPDNVVGIAAHRALAFADAGQLQCFRKDL